MHYIRLQEKLQKIVYFFVNDYLKSTSKFTMNIMGYHNCYIYIFS